MADSSTWPENLVWLDGVSTTTPGPPGRPSPPRLVWIRTSVPANGTEVYQGIVRPIRSRAARVGSLTRVTLLVIVVWARVTPPIEISRSPAMASRRDRDMDPI